jgi:hypothetical protein
MPNNEYSAQQALQLLMRKLAGQDPELASEVQAAIDAGKDVSETEPIPGRRKGHVYRRTVPFSHQEALRVALGALQAYFVEQPMFVDSAADNLAKSPIGIPTVGPGSFLASEDSAFISLEARGVEKTIEIEIQTETQISRTGEETRPLQRVSTNRIEEQRQHFGYLSELLDLNEG